MTADTPGKRVYLVRLALGDGLRTPMPMAEFAALLTEQGAGRYDSSTISKIENEMRKVALEEAPIFAAVDPLRRGAAWVAWGTKQKPADQGGLEDITVGAVALTPAQIARAEEKAAAIEAERRQSSTPARGARRPGSTGR